MTRIGRHDECTFDVKYETEALTAKCDVDYKGITNGVLTFVDNEYEKYIDVRVYDDMVEEKDETFMLNLISATGGSHPYVLFDSFLFFFWHCLRICCSC